MRRWAVSTSRFSGRGVVLFSRPTSARPTITSLFRSAMLADTVLPNAGCAAAKSGFPVRPGFSTCSQTRSFCGQGTGRRSPGEARTGGQPTNQELQAAVAGHAFLSQAADAPARIEELFKQVARAGTYSSARDRSARCTPTTC